MTKRPLAVIAVFFILGIVLAWFLPESVKFSHLFISTLIFITLTLTFPLKGRVKTANIFLLLSIVSFAALLYLNSNTYPNNHISHVLKEEKLKADILGVIKSPALSRKPYYGKVASTYLFEIEAIKDRKDWLKTGGLVQIRIETEKDYHYGDRMLVRGTMRRPQIRRLKPVATENEVVATFRLRKKETPGFNYREYLENQNIFALINTKENNITVLSHDYKSNPILKYTYSLREKLKNQIIQKMPLESGAFLRAILLGDRSELPKDIQTAFKNSGTMHILAISGLHVALIAVIIINLLKVLRIKREISYIFTMLFLMLFALIALSSPSVVRAVVMSCIFLIGMLLGRKVDTYNSLGAAAIFILIRNPKDLFNVGFQLSFLAVFSILYFVHRFMSPIKSDINFYVKKYIFVPLAVSISAWLGTAPLILYYFKIITPVSIIANLLIIPALFASLATGMTFLLLGWMPFLGPIFAALSNIVIHLLFSLAGFFSSLKFGHFYL